jgi:hypothetical protein
VTGALDLLERCVRVAEQEAKYAVQAGTPERRLYFDLARALRGVHGVEEVFALDPESIFPAIVAWCRILHAHPSDARNVPFDENAHRDVFVRVVEAWAKVRLVGDTALAAAVGHARSAPIELLPPLDRYGPTFAIITSTAFHLQRFRREKDIFLPCKALGALLDVPYTRVAAHLRVARTNGLLQLLAEGSYRPKPRAHSYRFNLESPLYRPPGAPRDPIIDEAVRIFGGTIIDEQGLPT